MPSIHETDSLLTISFATIRLVYVHMQRRDATLPSRNVDTYMKKGDDWRPLVYRNELVLAHCLVLFRRRD